VSVLPPSAVIFSLQVPGQRSFSWNDVELAPLSGFIAMEDAE
jgi:hypothetical protein